MVKRYVMTRLVLFNKPYGVLSQFSGAEPRETLAHFIPLPGVYPAGRLDKDSEGLLLLTDDGRLQHRISHPRHKAWKTYWIQVEGEPSPEQIERLRAGVTLKDGPTRPARVRAIPEPALWPRDPPVRFRRAIPTAWIEIAIHEGRNRQVRRMSAAVGLPTLRLVRMAVGEWRLDGLAPGEYRVIEVESPAAAHAPVKPKRRPSPPRRRAQRGSTP